VTAAAPADDQPPRRAWVLGGGGVIGVAWESGLAAGLSAGGVEVAADDVLVGTSAGAIVGVQLLHGRLPPDPRLNRPSDPPVDRSRLDVQALGKIFTLWRAMEVTSPSQVAAIGAIVRDLDRSGEPLWIRSVEDTLGGSDWPEQRMLVVAVDIESGERRVFERASGVAVARAVAASSSVPGLLPAVEIEGRLYMDGQAHSSTNADLLLPLRPAQVLIVAPTNTHTGRGIGPHAARMLGLEVEALQQAGCSVLVITPSVEEAHHFGSNLMDPARAGDAYDIGLQTGHAWAERLR